MAEQIVNAPQLYVNNLNISRASSTTLLIAAGQCRDSTNVFDMFLPSATTINAAVNGLNGLDTGSLIATKMYYVYVIADPSGFKPTGCLMSLSASPVLPFG